MTNSGKTNYLSHWLLTRLLEPILLNTAAKTASTPGMVRIVNISSHAHKNAPSDGIDLMNVNRTMGGVLGPVARYGSSKLLNILHAQELDRRYKDHADRRGDVASAGEIWAASIDPGRVDT
jgi:NAD(P)-dependent dehydrogenase (short-subunit alcohol dehydrogenase family)